MSNIFKKRFRGLREYYLINFLWMASSEFYWPEGYIKALSNDLEDILIFSQSSNELHHVQLLSLCLSGRSCRCRLWRRNDRRRSGRRRPRRCLCFRNNYLNHRVRAARTYWRVLRDPHGNDLCSAWLRSARLRSAWLRNHHHRH